MHTYLIAIYPPRSSAAGAYAKAARVAAAQALGEHKPGRIKRAALSLQNQHLYISLFFDTTPFICL